MDEGLGAQIATSAVPGRAFNRTPSGAGQAAGGEVTWDEMGQLGLHRALHEYYKLSASQKSLRLCGGCGAAGGPPSLLCTMVVPQLPAALSPPALLATARALLYAAGWLLYSTAVVTVPLALWLAFAAGGSLELTPSAAAAAARLHPAAGAAAKRLHATAAALPRLPQPVAAAALLALLAALQLAERAVLSRRQRRWEVRQRAATAVQVQARYARWELPGGSATSAADASSAAVTLAAEQRRQALDLLRAEVARLWQFVFGDEASLPAKELSTFEGLAAAVGKLCSETGMQLPAAAAYSGGSNKGTITEMLLETVHRIKADVGLA